MCGMQFCGNFFLCTLRLKKWKSTFNDTHSGNCVLLNSVQEFIEIKAWPLFYMFTQSINFYIFYCHILKKTDV